MDVGFVEAVGEDGAEQVGVAVVVVGGGGEEGVDVSSKYNQLLRVLLLFVFVFFLGGAPTDHISFLINHDTSRPIYLSHTHPLQANPQ